MGSENLFTVHVSYECPGEYYEALVEVLFSAVSSCLILSRESNSLGLSQLKTNKNQSEKSWVAIFKLKYLQIAVCENTQSRPRPTERTELLQELDPDPRNNRWTIVGPRVAAQ
jgi:hypothetical protein